MSEEYTEQDRLLKDINDLRRKIESMQEDLDSKKTKTWGAAVAIQQARGRLKALQSHLRPLEVICSHPDPNSLPPPLKRTRAEVRAFAGLPPLDEAND